MTTDLPRCDDCGHLFDPADKRGYVPKADEKTLKPCCPLCWALMIRGTPAWAVWNSCQGIFTDAVTHSRAEAKALLGRTGDEKVVPVRILIEPKDSHWRRQMQEDDRERDMKAAQSALADFDKNGGTSLEALKKELDI